VQRLVELTIASLRAPTSRPRSPWATTRARAPRPRRPSRTCAFVTQPGLARACEINGSRSSGARVSSGRHRRCLGRSLLAHSASEGVRLRPAATFHAYLCTAGTGFSDAALLLIVSGGGPVVRPRRRPLARRSQAADTSANCPSRTYREAQARADKLDVGQAKRYVVTQAATPDIRGGCRGRASSAASQGRPADGWGLIGPRLNERCVTRPRERGALTWRRLRHGASGPTKIAAVRASNARTSE
jgi:hypothetical protein